jgi:hypothetical protein
MPGRAHVLNPDERLDELHWVLSYHVGHLGRMADEMDRLSLVQAAKDFRQSVAIWDRLLQEIQDARSIVGASEVARGPAFPERRSRRRPPQRCSASPGSVVQDTGTPSEPAQPKPKERDQ